MRRIGLCAVAASAACTDPDVKCESVQFSVDSATVFFREPLSVTATPRGHLGVVVAHHVAWSATPAGIVSVVPTSPDGSQVQLRPTGAGTTVVTAVRGTASRAVSVSVPDTAYGVAVTPSAASLVVGDTLTLTALVSGPPGVHNGVRWRVPTGATVALLSPPESTSVRIQIIGTTPNIVARARADSTKSGTSSLTSAPAALAFVVQPTDVNKGLFIGPAVQVAIQNASGATSSRSAVTVLLAPATDGSCNPATRLSGRLVKATVAGVATFDNVGVDRTGSCKLVATASVSATSTTSTTFSVGPRGCTPVPYAVNDTVLAVIEATDCTVTRNGGVFYIHRYAVASQTGANFRTRLSVTSDFGPRWESRFWAPDTNAWVDSASAAGTFTQYYHGTGTHAIDFSSRMPGVTGEYQLAANAGGLGNTGCVYLTARGWTGGFPAGCTTEFLSRGSADFGRRFLFYLPAGAVTTITVGLQDVGVDPYLEVVDVTGGGRTLVGFDDNSGGGLSARMAIASAPTGRWIEAVAGRGAVNGGLTITIQ